MSSSFVHSLKVSLKKNIFNYLSARSWADFKRSSSFKIVERKNRFDLLRNVIRSSAATIATFLKIAFVRDL